MKIVVTHVRLTQLEKLRRWWDSAEECRAKAEECASDEGREAMLKLADSYQTMADRLRRQIGAEGQ